MINSLSFDVWLEYFIIYSLKIFFIRTNKRITKDFEVNWKQTLVSRIDDESSKENRKLLFANLCNVAYLIAYITYNGELNFKHTMYYNV